MELKYLMMKLDSTMIISTSIASISIFLSFILMIGIIFIQLNEKNKIKRDHLSNIFWLSFSDLGSSVGIVIEFVANPESNNHFCWWSGLLQFFFNISTHGWYSMIALELFLAIWLSSTPQWMGNRCLYHSFVWIPSILLSIIPWKYYGHDPSTGFCWITNSFYSIAYLIPFTLSLWFAAIVFLSMFYVVRSAPTEPKLNLLLLRTCFFVAVFVITWFPSWLNSLFVFLQIPVKTMLKQIATYFAAASGVCNFIIWFIFFPNMCRSFINIIGNSLDMDDEEKDYGYFAHSSINNSFSSSSTVGKNIKESAKANIPTRNWKQTISEIDTDTYQSPSYSSNNMSESRRKQIKCISVSVDSKLSKPAHETF